MIIFWWLYLKHKKKHMDDAVSSLVNTVVSTSCIYMYTFTCHQSLLPGKAMRPTNNLLAKPLICNRFSVSYNKCLSITASLRDSINFQ